MLHLHLHQNLHLFSGGPLKAGTRHGRTDEDQCRLVMPIVFMTDCRVFMENHINSLFKVITQFSAVSVSLFLYCLLLILPQMPP